MPETSVPIACTLTPEEFKERKAEHPQARPVGRSGGGRAGRMATLSASLPRCSSELARVVALERRCCAFLRFTLTVEPGNGPVWLEITGPAESKAFLATFWE